MIPCPEAPCTATRATPGALAAHLVDDHLISATVALQRAREAESGPLPPSRTDPLGLDRNGIKTHVEPLTDPALKDAPLDGDARSSVEPPVTPAVTPPASEEAPMGANKADPASCKFCLRFAPKKCKRHGGAPRSTSNRGRGPKPAKTRKARLGIAPSAAPAVSGSGHGTLDNAAKDAGETFLGHLLRVRDALDVKITSVKELLLVL